MCVTLFLSFLYLAKTTEQLFFKYLLGLYNLFFSSINSNMSEEIHGFLEILSLTLFPT